GVVVARGRLPQATEGRAPHAQPRDSRGRRPRGSIVPSAGTHALMRAPGRIARGLLTDPDRPVGFRFDGRSMQGLAGDTLAAAHRLGTSGLKVMLADQDVVLGGGSLLDARWSAWRESLCAGLAGLATVRCLPRTTVLGAYGHGVFGALETLSPPEAARFDGLRERLRIIRARRVVCATGALERLIAFPGNDLPGVMLAGAAHQYLRRYGVAVGRRPVFFL